MDTQRKILHECIKERRKLLRDKFESKDFRDGVVFLQRNGILMMLEGGGRDFTIQTHRLPKVESSRDEFDELYSVNGTFELRYDWCPNLSLIDLLATISIHVSVRYSAMSEENRDWFRVVHQMDEYPPEVPRQIADVEQLTYTSEQIQNILSWDLFWGDTPFNFHINYRDGNEKFLTAESKTHYYVVILLTS